MFAGWQLILFSLAYLLVLFTIAWQGDRVARKHYQARSRPWIYSLALTVYCTSWTFYGAVGQATGGGWLYLSIFIGPILTYLFAWPLVRKIFRVSKANNLTSIADFIASRYGKWQPLAIMVTIFALVGTLPYIALQLKAVTMAYDVLTYFPQPLPTKNNLTPILSDTAFFVALVLAIFIILFGTRHIDATEHHEGLLRAIAFESLIKLFAFLTVGAFVTWQVFGGFGDLIHKAEFFRPLESQLNTANFTQGFIAQTLLAMLAIILLPRMFHVTVVENAHRNDARYARWFLPLYLILFALFVMPIAAAGLITFPDGSVEPDTFVLTLPLAFNHGWLALLAYIGGFSAATSMAIMATVAVSIMVSNEIVIPALLKYRWNNNSSHQSFGRFVLRTRRLTMLTIMLLAYLTYRTIAEFNSLAATGFLAFAAIGQIAPAALGGIIWKGGNRWGAAAGLMVGGIFWFYTLLLPSLGMAEIVSSQLLNNGPWGITWLRPTSLFGLSSEGFFTQGVFWSLGSNLAVYILISRLTPQRMIDRIQASTFVDNLEIKPVKTSRLWKGSTKLGDLRNLAERFLGTESVQKAFSDYAHKRNQAPLKNEDPASIELIQFTERLLAGVLGASSARIVMSSALQGKEIKISDVISIVDEASQVLEFNRSLLQSTIENLSQGISVVDQHLNFVIWNQRYLEMFNFPDNFIRVGRPALDIFRYNAERGEYGPGDPETHVQQLLDNIREGESHRYVRYRKNGSVLEIQGNPMPGGGFVYSYQDITQQKEIEEALIQSENNIRIYTDNVPALIAYFDTNLNYLFTNRAYEKAMGIDRNYVIGKAVYNVMSKADYEQRSPFVRAALAGKRQTFELELPGNFRYALVTYTPHLAETGEVLGFFALYQDITERRLIEIALQETNENLEERVKERTLALLELNSVLFKENQVRAKAEEDMRVAKQQAEEANTSKTRFLAAASHDLLQPLNAARLFTSALANQVQEPELQKTTSHIDNSLKAAEELLSTLLDISKLDAGALLPKISDFPISEILEPLKAEFSVMAANRELDLHRIKTKAWVRSDPQMLRRILQNFLSNALRYTGEGRVLIGCRHFKEALRIEVWDTGPGIPESRISEIFQEFRRLDTPDKHNEKGLGLGLSIADRMSKVLNHPIKVRSIYGKGTVFSVTVPKVIAQKYSSNFLPGKRSFNTLENLSILCIDNEPLILEGMQALLEGWKCQVAIAEDQQQALEVINQQSITERTEIFLADYHLNNNKTGVMALKALEEDLDEKISGIIITADRTDEIANEVSDAGFLILHKPVKPAALRAMITRLLQTRKRLQAR
ncbi:MAG TPA: NahK/ErcS family hybrid sensor histidine kinase/response regulator [Marinospirillum sp.]|uniref:NahK/ErcS family hybrid sensor histidine kinase/response regulator n=1 Tax=Marinospirillum sp. TaxID=2183934 RepID=UPI002B467F28|nr:NahK/ErcS family hybrid sensor histidine kinase/response regulator [Marinospirillum sp.]HKM14913.1 NahK/ErcS family hybrid sensor histidine kinase/response regulator [Marinospirillum sp.]